MTNMEIKLCKVKQYNSSYKQIVMVNGESAVIVNGAKIASDCIAYLMGNTVTISDGRVKKQLDAIRSKYMGKAS